MTDTQLLAPDLTDFACSISDDAYSRRADALVLVKDIVAVRDAKEQQEAIAGAAIIKGLIKGIEAAHKQTKAPVLAAGRMIDRTKDQYASPLEAELKRLETLASTWQAQENLRLDAIRKEDERKAQIERDAAEAERRAYLQAISTTTSDAAKDALQKAADEAAERACEAERQRCMGKQSLAIPKSAGARVTNAKDYEVLDIRVLADARPDLVDITPKRALLLVAIQLDAGIPGLRVFDTVRVSAKASL